MNKNDKQPFVPAWVWSSGLEEWEPCIMSFADRQLLLLVGKRTWNGKQFEVWHDLLNRYIAFEVEPQV